MPKKTCNFCGSDEVILTAGYDYCIPCSRKLDRMAIHNMISEATPSITLEKIKDICEEMFESKDYCFSMFPKLYGILDRGPWLGKERRFKIPQSEYLVTVFHKYLQEKHPKLFERITHE